MYKFPVQRLGILVAASTGALREKRIQLPGRNFVALSLSSHKSALSSPNSGLVTNGL